MARVQFEEDPGGGVPQIPRAEPVSPIHTLMHAGIATTPGNAMTILTVCAFFLIVGSFFLLASAVPPPPTLGSDVLQRGETIPDYVK